MADDPKIPSFDEQELLILSTQENLEHTYAADFRIGFRYGYPRGYKAALEKITELSRALEQSCTDLNSAQDEICKLQNQDPKKHDWPEWSSPANTIRWAEKLLGKKLGKSAVQKEIEKSSGKN